MLLKQQFLTGFGTTFLHPVLNNTEHVFDNSQYAVRFHGRDRDRAKIVFRFVFRRSTAT